MSFLRRNPYITVGKGNDGDTALIAAAVNALPLVLNRVETRGPVGVENLTDRVTNAIENERLTIKSDAVVSDLTDEGSAA